MFNVDIGLKNGSILRNCSIFEEVVEDIRLKMVHITNKEKIEQQFSKMPWGNEHRFVYFQNEDMNGKVNVMNIDWHKERSNES
ncbi:hypothetical protein [Paenibacillus sp. QZ-Y1]|uniref:hypothetical protein n=1 Tax=Paenibacillus sp. QZ-Y1 TaxID=3414511 RepID=UPI003F7A12D9